MSRIDTFRIFIAVFLSIAMVGSMVAPYTGIAVADNDEQDGTNSATTIECQIATDLQKAGAIGNGENLDTPTECLQAIDKGESIQGLDAAINNLKTFDGENSEEGATIASISVRSSQINYIYNDNLRRVIKHKNGEEISNTEITKQSELNVLKKLKNDSYESEEDDEERGNTDNSADQSVPDSDSILDYSIDGGKLSVYPNEFRDSNVPNEAFESSSIPPFGAEGKITSFRTLTVGEGEDVKVVNGSDGELAVGIVFHGLPTHEKETYLYTNASKYPENITVSYRKQLGEEIATTEFDRSVKIPEEVMERSDEHASIYLVLESETPVDFRVNCMSIVINAGNSPDSCDEGRVQVESLTTNETDDIGDTRAINLDGRKRSASILEYDYNTENRDEGITYAGTYQDGDSDREYVESTLPLYGNPHGDIENYPALSDGDNSTAATLQADSDGLHVMMEIDDIEKGKYHMFAIRWDVEDGEKPDIRFQTSDGKLLEIPKSKIGREGFYTADLSKISDRINSGNSIFVTFTSKDRDTEVEVYCQTVISNPKDPQNSTCYGTIPEKKQQLKENNNLVNNRNIKQGRKLFKKYIYKQRKLINKTKISNTDPGEEWRKIREVGVKPVRRKKVVISSTSPGIDWVRIKKVDTKKYTVKKFKDSANKPGKDWVRIKKVGTKTGYNVATKRSTSNPGKDWNIVEKVGMKHKGTEELSVKSSKSPGEGWIKSSKTGSYKWNVRKTKKAAEKPGDGWKKIKRVGTKKQIAWETVRSIVRPGEKWQRGPVVGEKKIQVNTLVKKSNNRPGPKWNRQGVSHVETKIHKKEKVSRFSPGKDWEKIGVHNTIKKKIGIKTKVAKSSPGPNWKRIGFEKSQLKTVAWNYHYKYVPYYDASFSVPNNAKKVSEGFIFRHWTKIAKTNPKYGYYYRAGIHHREIVPARYETVYKWKKKVQKYKTKESTNRPGSGWYRVKEVGKEQIEPKTVRTKYQWVKKKYKTVPDYDTMQYADKTCTVNKNKKSEEVSTSSWKQAQKWVNDNSYKFKNYDTEDEEWEFKHTWIEKNKNCEWNIYTKKVRDGTKRKLVDKDYTWAFDSPGSSWEKTGKTEDIVDPAEYRTVYKWKKPYRTTEYKKTYDKSPRNNGWTLVKNLGRRKIRDSYIETYYTWKTYGKILIYAQVYKTPIRKRVIYYEYAKPRYKEIKKYKWQKTWKTKKKIYKWTKPVYSNKNVYQWKRQVFNKKPIYEWEKTVTKSKPVYTWNKKTDKKTPVFKWKRKKKVDKPIYRWKKEVKKTQPIYKWKTNKLTFQDIYLWKKTTKKTLTEESLEAPDNKTKIIGNVEIKYPPCKYGGELAEKSEFC